eukprot:Skav229403  [mRNA]  locus=scaffold2297:31960:39389:+ [translate_table: standard]
MAVHGRMGVYVWLRGKIRHEASGAAGPGILGHGLTADIEVRNIFEYTLVQRPSEPEEALARAQSRVGDDGYNLVWNNCEHFAETWSLDRGSQQASKSISWAISAFAGGLIGATLVPAATLWGSPTLGKAPIGATAGLVLSRLAGRLRRGKFARERPPGSWSRGSCAQNSRTLMLWCPGALRRAEAAEGNLRELQTELAKLQQGLSYATPGGKTWPRALGWMGTTP